MSVKMNAATIQRYGQTTIDITQQPIPTIGENDVLVEIYAASINPIDYKIQQGKMKLLLSYKMPLILGNDFAGVICAVGKNVTTFHIGDEVYGRPRKSRIGTFAEYIAIDVTEISLKPRNLSFEEAAAIPLVGLTTYQALHDIMHVQPQDKLLIHAGSGGVGTFAIQLAKTMGAYVATTTSEKNSTLVKKLGADLVINYRDTNFSEVLKDYDYVYDTLGGETLAQSFKVMKHGGKIVSISGIPNTQFAKHYPLNWWKTLLLKVASRKLTKLEKQYHVDYHFLFMKPSHHQLALLKSLIEQEKITPIIDKVLPLEAIQEAFNYSQTGRARGKIIIKIK